jgi:hypothetical protein
LVSVRNFTSQFILKASIEILDCRTVTMTDEKSASNAEAVAHHSGDADKDEAIAMVGVERHAIDPVVTARAVKKIDWFLIPAMIFGCKSRGPPAGFSGVI